MTDTVSFFKDIFRDSEGWFCLAWPDGKYLAQRWYEYPNDIGKAVEVAELVAPYRDVYFCAHLLTARKRTKAFAVKELWTAWAELDTCKPEVFQTPPTYVVETSPNNCHAYWVLDAPMASEEVELLNHKIAVANRENGCDQNGWALTKLLRVPNTINHKKKYVEQYGYKPAVKLVTL